MKKARQLAGLLLHGLGIPCNYLLAKRAVLTVVEGDQPAT